jgi:hypothetical protein
MCYTLFKVFKKDEKKDEDTQNREDSDYESSLKYKKPFKFRETDNHYQINKRSEETEDELNDYERYKGLDPDYLAYLKESRRIKREKNLLLSKKAIQLEEGTEVALTSNTGLTSITNTNVLMNDTLERMKYSLNKINNQLIEVERKGNPMEDPELESLRLQLTQTELQMAKIMSIVNSVSAVIDTQNNDQNVNKDDEQTGESIEIMII